MKSTKYLVPRPLRASRRLSYADPPPRSRTYPPGIVPCLICGQPASAAHVPSTELRWADALAFVPDSERYPRISAGAADAETHANRAAVLFSYHAARFPVPPGCCVAHHRAITFRILEQLLPAPAATPREADLRALDLLSERLHLQTFGEPREATQHAISDRSQIPHPITSPLRLLSD